MLLNEFLLSCSFIIRENDYRMLMSKTTANSLRNYYLRGIDIAEDGILTIYKIGILIEDIDRSNVVYLLLIKPLIDFVCIRVLGMDTVPSQLLALVNGLAESDSPISLKMLKYFLNNGYLTIGIELKSLTTSLQP